MRIRSAVMAVAMVGLFTSLIGVHASDGPYRKIKEIAIPGEGGWDYLNIDSGAHRLYVSHATKVVVVDTNKDEIVGEIADTPGVHGAVPAGPGRVFTSNGRGNNASVVDTKTLQTLTKVDTEGNPDFILYEPLRNEVYTFNGGGKSATVIDVAPTPRDRKWESFRYVARPGRPATR